MNLRGLPLLMCAAVSRAASLAWFLALISRCGYVCNHAVAFMFSMSCPLIITKYLLIGWRIVA
jgi:hypothetical protein